MPSLAPGDALFQADDLGDWMGRTVTDSKAVAVEKVVWGWLKPVLGLSERPSPVPDEVYSWAIELGAIAHENPAGMSSRQLGTAMQAFSSERRNAILEEAAGGTATSTATPRGSFPAAGCYPDPAF